MGNTNIKIGRDVTGGAGSNINIGSTLTNVIQSAGQISQGGPDDRAELERLLAELLAILKETPAEHAETAEAVASYARDSVEQIKKEQPNKTMLGRALDNLQGVARGLIEHAPKVLEVIAKLVPLIRKIGGLS